MKTFQSLVFATCSTLALFASASCGLAHPHVFAEARLDVAVKPDRTVEALRHVWRFDDLFSSTVLVEFDKNKDMNLDAEELEEVANVVHASLAEFNYFQLVTLNGKDVAMQAPERLMADFTDNQLIILFESSPRDTLKLEGTVDFGVYDPTFYTAIDFVEDNYMVVEGLPDGCRRSVIRPDPDEAIAQNQDSLTEAFFNDPSGNDLSKIFATRLEVECSRKG
ncbi:ABC-type uncharacterized transport system substrate-binding protein [Mesorhizobium sp. J18]|uniref:DUF1007 family protein n=1 Tax=Mesorhizobium sp. J18 TaxID=935263 RepID=UPI00119B40B5|nr:DUF1007 family protein [Mesorhizobium sp. J18]TWH00133.1 ABC-type uncharacterized transport system substrate-binding protein [Mesorhizobium sp. J18]